MDKQIEKIVKRGNSFYIKLDPKMMKTEGLKEGDYIIYELKKVEL